MLSEVVMTQKMAKSALSRLVEEVLPNLHESNTIHTCRKRTLTIVHGMYALSISKK